MSPAQEIPTTGTQASIDQYAGTCTGMRSGLHPEPGRRGGRGGAGVAGSGGGKGARGGARRCRRRPRARWAAVRLVGHLLFCHSVVASKRINAARRGS